jgi:endonuclease/exonuclease/phosphatase family metal-dependent hydrolase
LIVAGDLNATDQNHAYELIANELHDAWRRVGFGFGHTFPGHPTRDEGGSRPSILGLSSPLWLIRIDYIFHSQELEATSARLGLYPGPGGSDHRGVVATLTL